MRKIEEERAPNLIHAMINVLIGALMGLIVCIVFLFASAAAISFGLIGEDLMYQLSIAGCCIGGLLGGLVAVGKQRSRTLLVGIFTGALLYLMILMAGAVLYGSFGPEEGGVGLLCGALCGGALSGILGAVPPKRSDEVPTILPGDIIPYRVSERNTKYIR